MHVAAEVERKDLAPALLAKVAWVGFQSRGFGVVLVERIGLMICLTILFPILPIYVYIYTIH